MTLWLQRDALLVDSMPLTFRAADIDDYPAIEKLVIDSFEPITWQKKLDAKLGPLNGRDWRQRWQARLRHVFQTQIVLLGHMDGALCGVATMTVDRESALAFIDILAIGRSFQGHGLGREMLRATIEQVRDLGCHYVHLDCLTDNDTANALYGSEGFEEVARHIRWFKKL
ncbi:MAG TPA: GNAT family N-acetyltransferase [Pirellulaceae bacterium]|nr:GNAT family N-acetyltransferase [Pirellulaceae bacterium]